MNKVILVDVSNLFFRAFYAVPGHFSMKDGTPSNAVYGVISMIFSLLEAEKPTHMFIARDLRGPTFRHGEIDGYKAGRPDMPEDLSVQLPFVFEFFETALGIPLLSKESYEADDIIACLVEKFKRSPDCEVLILSNDHDLLQLVGGNVFVLQPQNGGKIPLKVDAEGVRNKMGVSPEQVADYKALAGDSSDKLAGVPGIGPKGACAILERYRSLEAALDHTKDIKGKNGRLLEEYREQAILTKKMATLHCNLELPEYREEAAKIPPKMPETMMPFLERIGSGRLISWAKRLFKEEANTPPAEQLGLF